MKFQAFACECGYNLATAEDTPKCPDCGKGMVPMKEDSKQYKKFNTELKQLFRRCEGMTAQQEREEMMRTFARFNFECPLLCSGGNAGTLIEVLEKLRKYEGILSAINVRQCNGYSEFNENYRVELETKDTTKKARVEQCVKDIADLMNFKVQFNNDPRGGAIRFILPSGASNGWDGETWGIYW